MIHTVNPLHFIAATQNGDEIYVNLIHSAAAEHIAQQPHILTLAKELLATHTLTGEQVDIEHDFGRIIGNCEVVETTAKDTIVYAKLLKHANYSRFVRKRLLSPSSYLSMSIYRTPDGAYEITDIWIGRIAPPFPTEEAQTPSSILYWSNHAIVLDGQPLQLRTLTKDVPY